MAQTSPKRMPRQPRPPPERNDSNTSLRGLERAVPSFQDFVQQTAANPTGPTAKVNGTKETSVPTPPAWKKPLPKPPQLTPAQRLSAIRTTHLPKRSSSIYSRHSRCSGYSRAHSSYASRATGAANVPLIWRNSNRRESTSSLPSTNNTFALLGVFKESAFASSSPDLTTTPVQETPPMLLQPRVYQPPASKCKESSSEDSEPLFMKTLEDPMFFGPGPTVQSCKSSPGAWSTDSFQSASIDIPLDTYNAGLTSLPIEFRAINYSSQLGAPPQPPGRPTEEASKSSSLKTSNVRSSSNDKTRSGSLFNESDSDTVPSSSPGRGRARYRQAPPTCRAHGNYIQSGRRQHVSPEQVLSRTRSKLTPRDASSLLATPNQVDSEPAEDYHQSLVDQYRELAMSPEGANESAWSPYDTDEERDARDMKLVPAPLFWRKGSYGWGKSQRRRSRTGADDEGMSYRGNKLSSSSKGRDRLGSKAISGRSDLHDLSFDLPNHSPASPPLRTEQQGTQLYPERTSSRKNHNYRSIVNGNSLTNPRNQVSLSSRPYMQTVTKTVKFISPDNTDKITEAPEGRAVASVGRPSLHPLATTEPRKQKHHKRGNSSLFFGRKSSKSPQASQTVKSSFKRDSNISAPIPVSATTVEPSHLNTASATSANNGNALGDATPSPGGKRRTSIASIANIGSSSSGGPMARAIAASVQVARSSLHAAAELITTPPRSPTGTVSGSSPISPSTAREAQGSDKRSPTAPLGSLPSFSNQRDSSAASESTPAASPTTDRSDRGVAATAGSATTSRDAKRISGFLERRTEAKRESEKARRREELKRSIRFVGSADPNAVEGYTREAQEGRRKGSRRISEVGGGDGMGGVPMPTAMERKGLRGGEGLPVGPRWV